ncbi:beta-phosphoglucomutase [Paenibacillus psychroresistens]|uniref:Beta-phosphoglucomutase n=1 Tax=Paenibacillus psychroresistens TaxID=1778678 RepID=A0A6B8REM0_9BACL|nr:beta-phosphoglucomutase [Paenibacillus psychroresistens]QGQ94377.1 beta-phosphoglucomutase [Paenibacillus psychroresistens]
MLGNFKGALFDLDGVIVDTAKFHFLAWNRLAKELGFTFTEHHNERLKGVSRVHSLEILLDIGRISLSEEKKQLLAELKNKWYVEYITDMDANEILPGAKEYLMQLRNNGIKIALGSASKNAPMILENLKITELFDVIIDGNSTSKAKPDPEVFLLGAEKLGLAPEECIVFEDAAAGVEAGKLAGMRVVGIGSTDVLKQADYVITGLFELVG